MLFGKIVQIVAFRQNCGFINNGIFVLLFLENFNFSVTFIHCTNKEPFCLGWVCCLVWDVNLYYKENIVKNGGNISK